MREIVIQRKNERNYGKEKNERYFCKEKIKRYFCKEIKIIF